MNRLHHRSGSATDTSIDACAYQLFEAQVQQSPDSVAVVFRDEHLTYSELDSRANQLAHYLKNLGVGPDVLVGICAERGIESLIGILGVLKAGGAYLPLDPEYPHQRLAFMLADAEVSVLLTQKILLQRISCLDTGSNTPQAVCLDSDWPLIAAESSASPGQSATDNNLAYVIYTSGSTGEPKGVQIERRGLCNMAEAQLQAFAIQPGDRVLQFSSLSFDASVFEVFMALRAGATLVIVPPESRVPGPALTQLMRQQEISIVTLPPSVLAALPQEDLPKLKVVTVAGEACSAELVARWAPGRHFFNLYGPTEATVWATLAECVDDGQKPSIGQPIANARVVLLDADLQPVPAGEPGELHISGAGLARGYLNRPQLNAEKFIPDPFYSETNTRLYRTGDIGRQLPDGSIEFIGRKDDQVKLRGFRIELGEVEAALRSHPEVLDAVVNVMQATSDEQQLVAHVVTHDDKPDMPASASRLIPTLREYLEQKLPHYMVPSTFVMMDALPLTIQGKVDRRALPPPNADRSQLSTDYCAPRTSLELKLAGLWERVLKLDLVGVNDNFFELGGDSLLGAVLINALQQELELSVQLYIVTLFDAPTIAEQAVYLQTHYANEVAAESASRQHPVTESFERITTEDIDNFRQRAAAWHCGSYRSVQWRKSHNPRMAFILSPPRSGSSLLRIMLAGNPRLFAPPELELLAFDSIQQRNDCLSGRLNFMREGLLRALMEIKCCDAEVAEKIVARHEARGDSVQGFYRQLQEWIGDRLLVDKSTTYALSPATLAHAEQGFQNSLYIHLVRHPYASIHSFEQARLDTVLNFEPQRHIPVTQFAELTWLISQQNILNFLSNVPAQRQVRIQFEQLLHNPQPVIETLCELLSVDFDPLMLEPYKHQENRMVDGSNELSVGMTDTKFHQHSGIDTSVAEAWKYSLEHDFLSEETWHVADLLGYERTSLNLKNNSVTESEDATYQSVSPESIEVSQLSDEEVERKLQEMLTGRGNR